jgi:hypothetical protein
MSISIWFELFCSNLSMSQETVDNISYRYKRITRQLNKDFYYSDSEQSHSFYTGSYGRGTEIHISDIDMIFQLPNDMYAQYNNHLGNGQSALLQAVKNSIANTYSANLKADGMVIAVAFSDAITFEVVPAFINTNGAFTHPDSTGGGSWRTTDPKPEINEITAKNDAWNKNLKRLCRMARAWKDQWNVPIGGLLIDTLAYNFLGNWIHKDKSYLYYDFMTRDFFNYLANQSESQDWWLSPGARQYVWRKGNFEYKAKRCYNISLEAIEKAERYPSTAKSKWREIFGTNFPL